MRTCPTRTKAGAWIYDVRSQTRRVEATIHSAGNRKSRVDSSCGALQRRFGYAPAVRAMMLMMLAGGCGGDSTPECRWPARILGYDDGGSTGETTDGGIATGCAASPAFNVCEVMDDGTQKCTDWCSSSEYSIGC